jgi:N6-L-threonylcarbamoyladenine synthase
MILAIESSCDETSLALLRRDRYVVHQLIASQIEEHKPFGGVVPELASRGHVKRMLPLLDKLMDHTKAEWDDIDAIAVTAGPGLIGSLLVGVETAKTLAWMHDKPLVPVNHLHGHAASVFLHDDKSPAPKMANEAWPLLSLIVSGGHTMLLLQDHEGGGSRLLGQTIDDAVGEAFDKVAKMLGLGYPGGPVIDKMAKDGDINAFKLPRPLMDREGYNFSYSGLKTAFLTAALKLNEEPYKLDDATKKDLCASFQHAAVDCLMIQLAKAIDEFKPGAIAVAGGVACNSLVRARSAEVAKERGVQLLIPRPIYCTDNAAMIGCAALEAMDNKAAELPIRGVDGTPVRGGNALRLNPDANLPMQLQTN